MRTDAIPVDSVLRRAVSRRTLLAAAGVTGLAAVLSDPAAAATASHPPRGKAQVGWYASANPGSVNTFWLQAPEGLVIVDTQRALSDARRALAAIQATGQPVVAILITHAHPDHVGGVGVLHQAFPDTPIYASAATDAHMRTDPLGFFELTREVLGEDYPAQLTFPNRLIEPNTPLELGGVVLETAEFGPGEHVAATAYYQPATGTLFAGDLINNQATPALLEGHSCGWLIDLDRLSERFGDARTIYPGHGPAGDAGKLIDQQRTYLEDFRGLVGPAVSPDSPGGTAVSPQEQTVILAELERLYPGYEPVASLSDLPERNLAAVAAELLAEDPTSRLVACCRT